MKGLSRRGVPLRTRSETIGFGEGPLPCHNRRNLIKFCLSSPEKFRSKSECRRTSTSKVTDTFNSTNSVEAVKRHGRRLDYHERKYYHLELKA